MDIPYTLPRLIQQRESEGFEIKNPDRKELHYHCLTLVFVTCKYGHVTLQSITNIKNLSTGFQFLFT
jgi:hypothetical protein